MPKPSIISRAVPLKFEWRRGEDLDLEGLSFRDLTEFRDAVIRELRTRLTADEASHE